MKSILIAFVIYIAALIAVAYICDRLHLYPRPAAPVTPVAPTAQQLYQSCNSEYKEYGSIVIACVRNNYSACGLSKPGDLPQHLVPNQNGIIWNKQNCKIYYAYLFDRSTTCTGGISNIEYSTTPVTQMARKLNQMLPNYSTKVGALPVRIIEAGDCKDGRVYFVIEPIPGAAV